MQVRLKYHGTSILCISYFHFHGPIDGLPNFKFWISRFRNGSCLIGSAGHFTCFFIHAFPISQDIFFFPRFFLKLICLPLDCVPDILKFGQKMRLNDKQKYFLEINRKISSSNRRKVELKSLREKLE